MDPNMADPESLGFGSLSLRMLSFYRRPKYARDILHRILKK